MLSIFLPLLSHSRELVVCPPTSPPCSPIPAKEFGWHGMRAPHRVCSWLLAAKIRGASKLNIASRNAPTTQKWDMPPGPWLVSEACPA